MKLLHQKTFISTYEEVEKVEAFLNKLQHELKFDNEFYAKLMLVVSEAVTNGIVHGNKLDKEKSVVLKAFLDKKNNSLIFESKDEGAGFKPELVPDPLAEENLLKASGRGVYLMKEYADEVDYLENGTLLKLQFNLPS